MGIGVTMTKSDLSPAVQLALEPQRSHNMLSHVEGGQSSVFECTTAPLTSKVTQLSRWLDCSANQLRHPQTKFFDRITV